MSFTEKKKKKICIKIKIVGECFSRCSSFFLHLRLHMLYSKFIKFWEGAIELRIIKQMLIFDGIAWNNIYIYIFFCITIKIIFAGGKKRNLYKNKIYL